MLDVNYLEANTEAVIERLNTRGGNYRDLVESIVNLNKKRKLTLAKLEQHRAQKNQLTKQISQLIHSKDSRAELQSIMLKISDLDKEIVQLNRTLEASEAEIKAKNSYLPNIPAPDVPIGKDESENVEVKLINNHLINHQNKWSHWEIAQELGWVDFELGTKLSGSRFLVYKGEGAKMIRVLADILLELHTRSGYQEYNVPLIVNKEIMAGTGQLPKFEDDAYQLGQQYLIPTGEVPLTNFVAHTLLNYQQLPLNLTTFSQCFRREAGSAGRDTRGFIRLHQFSKVELVKIVTPQTGEQEFKSLVHQVQKALNLFDLPYRIVNLASGDLGFSATKTYDFEVWFPYQNKYREISSCSLCGDFQARNMQARYRDAIGKTHFVETLNASGLAIDRLLAAILENHWDGERLHLPMVLQPYFNNRKHLG